MKNLHDLIKMKKNSNKISMITCYDYTSGIIVEKTNVDCVLIGDSSSMLMHGESNTTRSTLQQIEAHTLAVSRAIKSKLIIADLPFMSYHKSKKQTLEAVEILVRAGAQVIKLEGCSDEVVETIRSIIKTGIPVMGHLGLTPQHIHQFGGFITQGKTEQSAELIMQQSKALEEAGCMAVVLECIPSRLAKRITESLSIPTIGIGAGPDTDGQVLVFHDLLGLQTEFRPKFVKQYLNAADLFEQSINHYVDEVRLEQFPNAEHVY